MPIANRPGDVLADRYLLVDLLSESGNGRFWRAHDRVLDRHVAIHVIAAADERADGLMEAARKSATVTDRHVLRVLDVDRRDEVCYVVNEWGEGTSVDVLVANDGPLGARRAAWITAEVADTLASAHDAGVAHGRLVPENVLIDTAGSVRVIGFSVEAALLGLPGGRRTSDLTDLAGVLYFLLTGTWPGVSRSGVPGAPQAGGRVLRPRQVKAGVPRPLDQLCDRVINQTGVAGLPAAAEVAEELRDFVGDPTGLAVPAPASVAQQTHTLPPLPPLPVRDRHDPPVAPPESAPLAGAAGAAAAVGAAAAASDAEDETPDPSPDPSPEPLAELDPDRTVAQPVVPAEPPPTEQVPVQDAKAADTEADTEADAEPEADPEPEEVPPEPASEPEEQEPPDRTDLPTQAGFPIFDDERDEVAWLAARAEKPPPPPPFEDPPERPLFAPEPADGAPARRTRPGAAPSSAEYWPWDTGTGTGAGTGSGVLPVVDEPEDDETIPGRSWMRLAAAVAASLLLLVGVVFAFNLGRGRSPLGSTEDPSPSGETPTTSAPTSAAPVEDVTATDFDPQGDPPREENPELAGQAVDGDPATAWPTSTYQQQLGPAGLKTGVGLLLDLGSPVEVEEVDVTLDGAPTSVSVYVTPRPPVGVADLTVAGTAEAEAGPTTITLDAPTTGRYVVVWLTSLPRVPDGFQGSIAEVEVRAAS